METVAPPANKSTGRWPASHIYGMAAACLLVGLAGGYFLRGSQPVRPAGARPVVPGQQASLPSASLPTMDQMKQMADQKARPLLDQLNSEPRNAGLFVQVGNIYKATHQFKEAAENYGKSLEIDPTNTAARVEMASCLYYSGDATRALDQLQVALKNDPHNANALFNVGMIKWQTQHDAKGAVSAWQELLKMNPDLDANKKAQVEKLIAETRQPNTN